MNQNDHNSVARFTATTAPAHPEGTALGYPASGRSMLFSAGWEF